MAVCLDPNENADAKIKAVRLLDQHRVREAIRVLVPLVANEDDVLAVTATSAITNINSRTATRLLLRTLNRNSRTEAVLRTIYALRMLCDRRALPYLISILNDETRPAPIRDEAAEAMAVFPSKQALKALIRASNDPSPCVRLSVAYSLGCFKNKESADILQKLAHDHNQVYGGRTVSEQACDSLLAIKSSAPKWMLFGNL